MIDITIDGRELQVPEGYTILEAARENGIDIPTICYHEALEPYGACRLCVVELETVSGSQLVTSCTYPCAQGAVVYTNSEMVLRSRRMTLELLMATSGHVPLIQELAAQVGVEEARVLLEPNDCILCGRCVRACRELVGVSAISLVNRGIRKKVEAPFEIASRDCIGCGTCVLVCPTGAISLRDIGEPRLVHRWSSEFQALQCRICGDHYLEPEPLSDGESIFGASP